jgi:alpha-beta hydrolase superfamily lysophospholipase
MTEESGSSLFDRPEILSFVFHPRKDIQEGYLRPNWHDHAIGVEEGVTIGCRFYIAEQDAPNLLYFHGNGEIVSDHDNLAPIYNKRKINLFVADYRGYGTSTGTPTFSAMLKDAHILFDAFCEILSKQGFTGSLFLMGRSLGSASVIEIAYHDQDRLKGMVIESGFADPLGLFQRLGIPIGQWEMEKAVVLSNIDKVQSITVPTLIIHGENDFIIPVDDGKELYNKSGSEGKRLLIIPGAGHNDLLFLGMEAYFQAIDDFVH